MQNDEFHGDEYGYNSLDELEPIDLDYYDDSEE